MGDEVMPSDRKKFERAARKASKAACKPGATPAATSPTDDAPHSK